VRRACTENVFSAGTLVCMREAITITLFGGPADGRTMAAPHDADYVDFHVRHGRALFDANTNVAVTTHRYWIEKSSSGTHGIAMHAGPVAYRRGVEDALPEGA
jgi:hypothetical protein